MHHPRVRGKTAFGGDANVHFSLQPMAFQQPRRHDRLGETRVGMYPGRARHRLSQSLAKNHIRPPAPPAIAASMPDILGAAETHEPQHDSDKR